MCLHTEPLHHIPGAPGCLTQMITTFGCWWAVTDTDVSHQQLEDDLKNSSGGKRGSRLGEELRDSKMAFLRPLESLGYLAAPNKGIFVFLGLASQCLTLTILITVSSP